MFYESPKTLEKLISNFSDCLGNFFQKHSIPEFQLRIYPDIARTHFSVLMEEILQRGKLILKRFPKQLLAIHNVSDHAIP